MSKGVATIARLTTGGPFMYEFRVDGAMQNAAVGVATIGAAMDAVKPLITALPGAAQSITIIVVTT